MSKLNYPIILEITKAFYDQARNHILIGFHFRVIADFETHIPRIANFWQLQLTGKMEDPENLPFKLLEVHRPMKLTYGMVDTWVKLFYEVLDFYQQNEKITEKDLTLWKNKIEIFKEKIKQLNN